MKTKISDFFRDCFAGTKLNILFFIGILLLLTWMPLEYGARYINTQVAGQVICGGLILLLIREKLENLFKYPLWSISIFWISVLTLSFIFSVIKLASLEELMRNVLYVSLPIVVYSWCRFNDRIKLLSYTVLGSGTLITGIAIFTFLKEYIQTQSFNPAYAPLSRTNDLGAFMLLIFPLSLSNFLYEEEEPLEKAAYALVTILSFITIILTFSRGIWLSTMTAVILILFLGRKILKKNLIYIGIVAVLSVIPIIMNWENTVHRLASLQNIFNTAENSIEWRKSLLRGSWNIFMDHPVIGTGLNTFAFVFSFYQERAGYFSINPHNYYLQLLTETGIIGFITFIILALSILYMSFKAFTNSEKIFKGIALGLLVGIISSLIHISVDIDWSVSAIPILFWVQVGLLMAIYSQVNFKETRFISFNDRFNYLKRPALFIIALSLIIIPTANYLSLNFYARALSSFERNDIDGAYSSNISAMRFSPSSSAKHNNLQALILIKQGKLTEAIEKAEKAISIDKYNYNYYQTYSDIYQKLYPSDTKKPLEALKTAVSYNPYMHPKLYGNVANYYSEKLHDNEQAISWLKDAIEHFPIQQIPSYESYTPDDRYELYKIYKDMSKLMNEKEPGSGKKYKAISDSLLITQMTSASALGEITSTPTATIKNYWKEYANKNKDFAKFIYPGIEIFNPPENFSYEFVDFDEIERDILTSKITYRIILKQDNNKREFALIDQLSLTDNGWLITSRLKKE